MNDYYDDNKCLQFLSHVRFVTLRKKDDFISIVVTHTYFFITYPRKLSSYKKVKIKTEIMMKDINQLKPLVFL